MLFDYCSVPKELRNSIIIKKDVKAFSNLACTSKLAYSDCLFGVKRHKISIPNVYLKDEAIIGYTVSKKSLEWADLVDCGFDYNIDRLRIMSSSAQRIIEGIDEFKGVIHSVDTLIFPKNWPKIPLKVLKELIKVAKPRVINIPGNLINYKISDFESKNQAVIFYLDNGTGITDEDFLQLNQNLKIYSDCLISLPAILQKIKKWKSEKSAKDSYFHYIGRGANQLPDDYSTHFLEIGAKEVMRKPRNWKERPLWWKDLQAFELICDDSKEIINIWLSKDSQQKRIYIEKNLL